MMPLPHRIRVRRKTSTASANWNEVAGGAAVVYDEVRAMISPTSTSAPRHGFGQMEREDELMFLAANDVDGQPHVIRVDDLLINITPGSDGEVWIAITPGNRFENPTTFHNATPDSDHIEINVARMNVETHTL